MARNHKLLSRARLKAQAKIGRLIINALDLFKILIKYKCAMNLIVANSRAIFGTYLKPLHIAETIKDWLDGGEEGEFALLSPKKLK